MTVAVTMTMTVTETGRPTDRPPHPAHRQEATP